MNEQVFIRNMLEDINKCSLKNLNIMEVCGTHTQAISRFGIRQLVESNIHLLSGPGCPVCVTSEGYIDAAIYLLKHPNVILTTFGDMMKVRGSKENLMEQKEKGKDIRILYSPLDSIILAEKSKDKEIVFLAVGFETTAPLIALAVKIAKEKNIRNLSFLIGIKRMAPILHQLLSDDKNNIQGLICPGHVAAVKGEEEFKFITEQYNIPAVISGFGALDMVSSIYFLVEQQEKNKKQFKNLYKSCVSLKGNRKANELLEEVFTYGEAEWRGIGTIKDSGLFLGEGYTSYDASQKFGVRIVKEKFHNTCACSHILLGRKSPPSCKLFGKFCTPEKPAGPCMVSSEGACSIFYKYKEWNK
jgi:hydrogenase expression/formation protein HypD